MWRTIGAVIIMPPGSQLFITSHEPKNCHVMTLTLNFCIFKNLEGNIIPSQEKSEVEAKSMLYFIILLSNTLL